MSKKLNSKNLNEIFGDIIHFGRDVKEIYPKENIYDGKGNYLNISSHSREKIDINSKRGDVDSPNICKNFFLGYNAGTIEFPNLAEGTDNQSYENNIFFNLDKYSSLYIELSNSNSLNFAKLKVSIISDFLDLTPSGYFYPYGFFDNSKNPPILYTTIDPVYAFQFPQDISRYQAAIIIPQDIENTGIYSEFFPSSSWSLAVRKKERKNIDNRITNKSFYLIINNSSNIDIDNKNLIEFSKSNPIIGSVEGELQYFKDITTLPMARCSNLPAGQESECSYENLSWKISAKSKSIFEIYIPEPTFYLIPNNSSGLFGSFDTTDEINYGIDLDYYPAATNRVWYRKLI